MKKLLILAALAIPMALVSCQPPVHDVVYVPVQTATKTHTVVVQKPKKESAEGFEAVQKPSSYSN